MRRPTLQVTLMLALLCALRGNAFGQQASPTAKPTVAAGSITAEPMMQSEELVQILSASGGDKPLIFMVGPHSFYAEAHVPGSEYIGPGREDSGLEALRDRVQSLPNDQFIVLYCGCCPWNMCPNVRPAYQQLVSLGFKRVKMLYIAKNFGTDWVKKGYPVEKGR